MTEGDLDHYLSWELAIACLRVELESGQKLSPQEMIEEIDGEAMPPVGRPAPSQDVEPASAVSPLRASVAISGEPR